MAVMARREGETRLTGRVEMDDAYLGGVRSGGKRGRGAAGKTPFVAAVSTSPEGRPRKLKLAPVKGFRKREIARGAKHWLAPGAAVVTDGLGCWGALDEAAAFTVDGILVCHDILHANPAVLADLAMRDGLLVEELDEERTGDVQYVGGLNRGEFGAFRNQCHALARGHGFQDMHEQVDRAGREIDRLFLFAVSDAQLQGPVRPAVRGQSPVSASCDRSVPRRRGELPMS